MVRPKIAKSGKFPFSCSQRRRHQRKRLERHSTTDLREEKPTQANNPFTPHDSDSNLSEMPSSGQVVAFYGPQAGGGAHGPTYAAFEYTGKIVKPETYNSGQSKNGGQGGQQSGSGQQGSTGGR